MIVIEEACVQVQEVPEVGEPTCTFTRREEMACRLQQTHRGHRDLLLDQRTKFVAHGSEVLPTQQVASQAVHPLNEPFAEGSL
jgi:hypothetical protein